MTARHLLPLAFVLALLASGPAPLAVAGAGADPVSLDDARTELAILTTKLRDSKATNDELVAALEAVAHAYHHPLPPQRPEPEAIPEDAAPDEVKEVEARNAVAGKAHARALRRYRTDFLKFQRAAEKLVLKALKLQRLRGKPKANTRVDVNVAAARILGGLENPKLTRPAIAAFQKVLDAKYDVPALLLEEGFAGLARLGDPAVLAWMIENFTHTMNSPPREVARLEAAHQAMILFPREETPGRLRHALVKRMVERYASLESKANESSNTAANRSAKELWDRIRPFTIRAVQHFAGEPQNEEGEVLATMREFQSWFRVHKDLRHW